MIINNIGNACKSLNTNNASAPSFCGTFEFKLGDDYKCLDDVFVRMSDEKVTRFNCFFDKMNEFAQKIMPENHNLKISIDNNWSRHLNHPEQITINYGVKKGNQSNASVIYQQPIDYLIGKPLSQIMNLFKPKSEAQKIIDNEKDAAAFIETTIKPVMTKEQMEEGRASRLNNMEAAITE